MSSDQTEYGCIICETIVIGDLLTVLVIDKVTVLVLTHIKKNIDIFIYNCWYDKANNISIFSQAGDC